MGVNLCVCKISHRGCAKRKKGRGNQVKVQKEITDDYKSKGPYGPYSYLWCAISSAERKRGNSESIALWFILNVGHLISQAVTEHFQSQQILLRTEMMFYVGCKGSMKVLL